MARKKRPIWLTLLGLAVLVGLSLSGLKLPEPVRNLVRDVTGISLPASENPDFTFAAVDPNGLPRTKKSFDSAKKALYSQIHGDNRVSLYCGCAYNEQRQVDHDSCGVTTRKDKKRSNRIEAEHIMPASHFGQHRRCWREEICTDSGGKPYKGRECCEATDDVFKAAHNDLHNLWPAVGEINADRSNYRWGMISGEDRDYGRCDIEVDTKLRRAEPPEQARGNIARTYFYMEDTYGFNLSDQQRQLFTAWDRQDPPDEWENERNSRIARIQGKGNRFIEEWATE